MGKIRDTRSALDINHNKVDLEEGFSIIWPVTSANHSNTRRNPFPANRREAMIEAFSSQENLNSLVYLINDIGQSDSFAKYILKEVEAQSRTGLVLTPDNCVVACSTPEVIGLFEELGFVILPVELINRETGEIISPRPWEYIVDIAKNPKWREGTMYREGLHVASKTVLEKYNLGDLIVELFEDPLIGEEGDITQTRNYEVYRKAFEDGARRKYELIKEHLQPGRLLDIGCATGEFVKLLSEDDRLRESDIYGVEIARPLYEMCQQRKSNGEFSNDNIFFFQRNILSSQTFRDNSIRTITSISVTHEIWSYLGEKQLYEFVNRMYQMLEPGGVWINMDVVAPNDKDDLLLVKLNRDDGETIDEPYEEFDTETGLEEYLGKLSSFSRFKRFARDFRSIEDEMISYEEETIDGVVWLKMKKGVLADYLAKKDYLENWRSEMHEVFCFWGFDDWMEALKKAGFSIHRDSESYTNEWLINNRFKLAVSGLKDENGSDYSVSDFATNVLLIATK